MVNNIKLNNSLIIFYRVQLKIGSGLRFHLVLLVFRDAISIFLDSKGKHNNKEKTKKMGVTKNKRNLFDFGYIEDELE